MIFQTAEIRWFFEKNLPEVISEWFIGLDGKFEKQEARTDFYLQLENNTSLGIKIREGKFEIKERQSTEGKVLANNNIEGISESWTKWSFESAEDKYPLNEIVKGNWIEVIKARKLQKYIFDQKGLISGGFDDYRSDGCNVELTKIKSNSSDDLKSSNESKLTWWTLGLETYGTTASLERNLQTAFDHIFQSKFPGTLSKENSFGYPEWLLRFQSCLDLL